MDIRITNISPEEFMENISGLFNDICKELDIEYDYNDGCKKESYNYNFDKNKLESSKQEVKDDPDKIIVNKEGYNALIAKNSEMRKEIDRLNKQCQELLKAGKDVSDNGHKIVDKNNELQHIINDKIYADGYKIMNDIKIYIEFARKCDAFKNGGFKDMINLIAKTVNDFIASQKEPVFC